MKPYLQKSYRFVAEKLPFALTGFVATAINYGLYLLLVDRYLPYLPATVVAYASSVVLNFFMQYYFVFELRRSLRSAFLLSMLVSLGGLLLDAALVSWLHSDWMLQLSNCWSENINTLFGYRPSSQAQAGTAGTACRGKGDLEHKEWLIKGISTTVVFFYNFYLKRYVFEGSSKSNPTELS